MEIPEIYIDMCDCEEIQSLRGNIMERGDFLEEHLGKNIWIPRQDQLQVLLRQFYSSDFEDDRPDAWFPEGYIGLTFVLREFHEFAVPRGSGAHVAYDVKSFEELWLRFYMWEAHGKTWSRDRWVGPRKREIPITPVKGSDGHKEKMAEINKRLKDPDAKEKQKKNLEEMKKLGSG